MSTVEIDEGDVKALIGILAACSGLIVVGVDSKTSALEGLKRRISADAQANGYAPSSPQQLLDELNFRLRAAIGEKW